MLTSVVAKRQSDRVGRSFGRRRSSSVRLSKPILFASDFFSWHALLLSPFNVWDSVCLKWLDTPHLLLLFLLWQKVRSLLLCVKVSDLESFCLSGKQGYRKQLIVKTLDINWFPSVDQTYQTWMIGDCDWTYFQFRFHVLPWLKSVIWNQSLIILILES